MKILKRGFWRSVWDAFLYELRDEIRHVPLSPSDEKVIKSGYYLAIGNMISGLVMFALTFAYSIGPTHGELRTIIAVIAVPSNIMILYLNRKGGRRNLLYSVMVGGFLLVTIWIVSVHYHNDAELSTNYFIFLPIWAMFLVRSFDIYKFYPIMTVLWGIVVSSTTLFYPLIFDYRNSSVQIAAFLVYILISAHLYTYSRAIFKNLRWIDAASQKAEQQKTALEQMHSLLDIALAQSSIGLICFNLKGEEILRRGHLEALAFINPANTRNMLLSDFEAGLERIGLERIGLERIGLERIGLERISTQNEKQDSNTYNQIKVGDQCFFITQYQNNQMITYAFIDVTEREKWEKSVRETQKLGLIGQLASGIAHDYNNILAIALSNIEAIPYEKHEGVWREYISPAVEAIEQAKNVSRKLFTLARQRDLNLEAIKLSSVVEGMEPIFVAALGAEITFEADIPSKLVVRADHQELESALLNLVLNAKKAIKKRDGKVRIYTELEKEEIALCVEDNGIGIPKEIQERIFDPFFTTKQERYSTGLGLSMVKGFIEQAGGRVEILSRSGKTVFKLWLKLIDEEMKATKMDKKKQGHNHLADWDESILLVDDNLQLLTSMARLIKARGVECYAASTRLEALEMIEAHDHISIAVLDLSMPDISGLELGEELLAKAPDLRCFILTGAAGQDILDKIDDLGFEGLLLKPISVDGLLEKLRT